jgi:hypothetical protein
VLSDAQELLNVKEVGRKNEASNEYSIKPVGKERYCRVALGVSDI